MSKRTLRGSRSEVPAAAAAPKSKKKARRGGFDSEIFIPAKFIKIIGQGGMGTCALYRTNGGDEYVKKTFNTDVPNADIRLGAEIEALRRLNHPSILPAVHYSGDPPFYITPFYSNGDLASYLEKNDAITMEKAVDYMIALLEALEVAHEASILHRDLKATNILVNDEGDLIISDWGCAYFYEDGSHSTANIGTVRAPELFKGEHPSECTDVFCLGDVFETILRHTDNPDFSAFLLKDLVYAGMMHANASDRLQDCADVRQALEDSVARFVEAAQAKQAQLHQQHIARTWNGH